jgi:hypothetical protein
METRMKTMIKACIDPQCDEIAHNIEKQETHCRSCGGLLVTINQKSFVDKFINNFFQYDYTTGNLLSRAEITKIVQSWKKH